MTRDSWTSEGPSRSHWKVKSDRCCALARIRIWKRGGGGGFFWKSEKTANDLDRNFNCSWIKITRFIRKLRQNFSENSEIQTLFHPKNRWSPKKKRSSPKLRRIFRPEADVQTLFQADSRHLLHNFGTQFSLGGRLFSFFHQKSASKAPKTCPLEPPTPPWLRYWLCKRRADIIITLEQRSSSNRVFCKQIGLFWGGRTS